MRLMYAGSWRLIPRWNANDASERMSSRVYLLLCSHIARIRFQQGDADEKFEDLSNPSAVGLFLSARKQILFSAIT